MGQAHLVGARYSNMLWLWLASILSKEQGIGSVQKRSWLRALSASSLEREKSSNEEELLVCGFLPLARVQGQKLVNEVTSILVLHIRFQPLLHPPLASTRDLKLLKQIQPGDAWPHL